MVRPMKSLVGHFYRNCLYGTLGVRRRLGMPVVVAVGSELRIRLLPEGQIAELAHTAGYENLECRLVSRLLSPGMTVIDIGANVGLYSIIAAKRVAPGGRVWAIEPSSETYARLLANLELNAVQVVTPVRLALSTKDDGSATLLRQAGHADGERFLQPGSGNSISVADAETVATLSLDTFCARSGIARVDFIKMDVEGGEYDVFRGSQSVLRTNPDLVMVFEHTREGCARAGRDPEEIRGMLKEFGLSLYGWDDRRKTWESDFSFILDTGNAWATADKSRLPVL
jgi:FkbM family methyltransferase